MFIQEINIIILIWQKLGSIRPAQQKVKLPLPKFHYYTRPNKSDMTECIYHLIGHRFSQFQVMLVHFCLNKKLKISSFLGFNVIYQRSRNNKHKDVYLTHNITNNHACALFSVCVILLE